MEQVKPFTKLTGAGLATAALFRSHLIRPPQDDETSLAQVEYELYLSLNACISVIGAQRRCVMVGLCRFGEEREGHRAEDGRLSRAGLSVDPEKSRLDHIKAEGKWRSRIVEVCGTDGLRTTQIPEGDVMRPLENLWPDRLDTSDLGQRPPLRTRHEGVGDDHPARVFRDVTAGRGDLGREDVLWRL